MKNFNLISPKIKFLFLFVLLCGCSRMAMAQRVDTPHVTGTGIDQYGFYVGVRIPIEQIYTGTNNNFVQTQAVTTGQLYLNGGLAVQFSAANPSNHYDPNDSLSNTHTINVQAVGDSATVITGYSYSTQALTPMYTPASGNKVINDGLYGPTSYLYLRCYIAQWQFSQLLNFSSFEYITGYSFNSAGAQLSITDQGSQSWSALFPLSASFPIPDPTVSYSKSGTNTVINYAYGTGGANGLIGDAPGDYTVKHWITDNTGATIGSVVTDATNQNATGSMSIPTPGPGQSYTFHTSATGKGGYLTYTSTTPLSIPSPQIIQNPQNVTVNAGSYGAFTVVANGSGLSYQWQADAGSGFTNITNGGVYSNATTSTLNITGATLSMNGYRYRCVVSGYSADTSKSAVLSVVPTSGIDFTINNPQQCFTGNNFVFTPSPATGTSAYSWDFGDGASGATGANPSHSYATDGTYTVTLTDTSSTGDIRRVQHTIRVNPSPVAQFVYSTIPPNSSNEYQFTDKSTIGSGSISSYAWYFNYVKTSTTQNTTYLYSKNTAQTSITLTVTSSFGCAAQATEPPLNAYNDAYIAAGFTVNNQTQCNSGNSFVFTDATTVSAGTSIYSYYWDFGDGTAASTLQSPTHHYTAPGTYIVTEDVFSNDPFTANTGALTTQSVIVFPTPDLQQPANLTVCGQLTTPPVYFTPTNPGESFNWTMSTDIGAGTRGTYNIPPFIAINTGNTPIVCTVTVTPLANGCSGTPKTFTITVNPALQITQNPKSDTVFTNADTSFTVAATGGGSLAYQWQVNPGSGFVNINNGGVYSNAATSTLNITGASFSMNGYSYRCIVSGCTADTSASALLTVNKQAQTLAFVAQTNGSTVNATYGDGSINGAANSSGSLTPVYGSNDTLVAKVDNTGKITIKGAGTAIISVSQPGDSTYSAATGISFTLKVAAKPLTITANNATKTYDGTAYNGGNGVSYSGFAFSDNASSLSGTLTYGGTAQGAVNTGSYTLVPQGLTSNNYTIQYQAGTLLITSSSTNTLNFNTQTANAIVTVVYGSADINGSAVASSGLTAAYASSNTAVATVDASGQVQVKGTGSATITASQAGNSNYNPASNISFTIQVSPAPLTVTAANATKTFDGTSYSGGNGVSFSGFVNNETSTVLTGTMSYGGTAQGATNTGNYTIIPSGLASPNYTISFVNGTLSIVASGNNVITFNSQTAGSTVSVVYGQAPIDGSAKSTSGLTVNYASDNTTTATVSTTGQITIVGAGTANITATQPGNGNFTAASPQSYKIVVAPQPLTVTANNYTKTYNGAAYSGGNGVVYTGFVNGENSANLSGSLAYTGSAQGAVNTGSYLITPSGYSSPNYAITYKDGSLIITKAALNITANVQTKVYGSADPALTYTATGFAGTDNTKILTGGLIRTAGENVGSYAINQNNLSAGNNYNIVYTGNTFTITPAPQTITWSQDLTTGCNGVAPVQLAATTSSGLPVTYTAANTNIATINGDLLTPVQAGSTIITATQAGDANHYAATAATDTFKYLLNGLVVQHWNDVLIFDNTGSNYTQWQWFKNDNPVAIANSPYYGENAPLSGTYYVLATDKNGNVAQTCPVILTGNEKAAGGIKVAPNPLRPGATATVMANYSDAALQNASLLIVNMSGTVVERITPVHPVTTVTMPAFDGIYVVTLLFSNGQKVSTNIIIN